MNKSSITIPEGSTAFFVNTKNKYTFYSGSEIEGWNIYNRGLDTWERIPNLDLTLRPIEDFDTNLDQTSLCSDVEDTEISVITVKSSRIEDSIEDFRTPALSLQDFEHILDLFYKYAEEDENFGFIPGEPNYTLFFDHEANLWTYVDNRQHEFLSIYTPNLKTITQVIDDLNQI